MISEELKKQVENIITLNDVALARMKLQELGNQTSVDVQEAVVPLQLLCLPLLKKEEVLVLFDHNFSRYPLAGQVDIADKLRRRFSLMPREERETFIALLSSQADPTNLEVIKQSLTMREHRGADVEDVAIAGESQEGGAQARTPLSEPVARKQLTPILDTYTQQKLEQKKMLQKTREQGASFDQHDALEVDWHRANMTNPQAGGLDYNRIAADLAKDYNLVWDDPLMKRFVSVISSRLKDIRSEMETKDLMTRAKKIGGLEIASEVADTIISTLRPMVFQPLPNPESDGMQLSSIGAPSALRLAQDVDRGARPRPPQPPQAKGMDQAPPDGHLADAVNRPQPVRLVTEEQPQPLSPQPQAQGFKVLVQKITEPAQPVSPQVTDIKLPPNAAKRGPLSLSQSIGSLNISDVRNAPGGIDDILGMIKNEIESTEPESFIKKMEMIKAWHGSPLYNLYVSIGSRCMESGLPIAEVLKNMGSGDQTLTQEEFDKIVEFNRAIGL